jgi:hypothetical protein
MNHIFISIMNLITLAVSAITILVLIQTKNAANKQAKAAAAQAEAARILTEVSKQQLEASKGATQMAIEANALTRAQILSANEPVLVLIREPQQSVSQVWTATYLQNQGTGIAHMVLARYMDLEETEMRVSSSTIGVGHKAHISFSLQRFESQGLFVSYQTADGRRKTTRVTAATTSFLHIHEDDNRTSLSR